MSTKVRSATRQHKGAHPKQRSMTVLAETIRLNCLPTLLSRKPQKVITGKAKRLQSDKAAPVIWVNDLEKKFGSEVEIELRHDLRGKPTMGTNELAGREEERTSAFDDIKIDRTRHGVKDGDVYDTQESGYKIKDYSQSDLAKYYHRLEDQRTMIHLAGARGHFDNGRMIVPRDTDKDFKRIMVNPVTAPSRGRHFMAGGRDNIADMALGDEFTLMELREIKERLEEMEHPLEPIDLSPEDDPYLYDPAYIMLVTPRAWTQLRYHADSKLWLQMQNEAHTRRKDKNALAVFRGDCFMFENILIRKAPYPVRFMGGKSLVQVDHTSHRYREIETQVPKDAKHVVERQILLGGDALGLAFGNAAAKNKSGKLNFSFETEDRDFKTKQATSIAWANGMKKLRFENQDGCMIDRGVIAFDCAVPKKAGDDYDCVC